MSEQAARKRVRGQTPLMRQFFSIKSRHPDTILLFRMGDFYETFGEDAKEVHAVLGITLTKRSNGAAADVALAGFPYHALDTYLPKLVRAGYRVAICEQLEDPKQAKKIVKRDVVEVVTPGVSFRDNLLTPAKATYVAAIHFGWRGRGKARMEIAGIAFADVSTGEFRVAEVGAAVAISFLDSIGPGEIILTRETRTRLEEGASVRRAYTLVDDWVFTPEDSLERLTAHFGTHSLKGFGVEDLDVGLVAAGAVLHYMQEAQKGALPHIRRLEAHRSQSYMTLDAQTRRNMELVSSLQAGEDGSLVAILDRTATPMGARMLRHWLLRPLRELPAIVRRQEAVHVLVEDAQRRNRLDECLEPVGDLERMLARVCMGRCSPRDLKGLGRALGRVPAVQSELQSSERAGSGQDSELDTGAAGELDGIRDGLEACPEVASLIAEALVDDPPATLRDGGVIREGYNEELDELRNLAGSGRAFLAGLQKREAERTGISSLKIGFNKVFGYYLEVTHTHKDKVPPGWIRKQTLVSAERYITEELKEYEEKILGAEERMGELEARLFEDVREHVASYGAPMQTTARLLARLDVLVSLAHTAIEENWTRPDVDDSTVIDIRDGRHPVVERSLPPGEPFVPNDVCLSTERDQIVLVTGPNMAGKSVILRQVGLIVLLAQMGSYVPASKARIGLVDRIFTRVGASDNLAAGESTFLVEMNETANILNNATDRSLILLDEVGRGTSTFDGLSIAWALVEYLHEESRVAARTLFATHYHELNALEEFLPRVRSFRVQVQEHDDRVIFLRKLVRGGADHSYGIEVARMAGLPEAVIGRARSILADLEAGQSAGEPPGQSSRDVSGPSSSLAAEPQMDLFTGPGLDPAQRAVLERLREVSPEHMTPLGALVLLSELSSQLSPTSLSEPPKQQPSNPEAP